MNELKQPKVLIVILNYGTYDLTIKIIKDIKQYLDYNNYSVMVIDNCSPNDSAQVLKEESKQLDFIFYANKKNTGYAAGNNIGIRYAIKNGFEYTWILNNDVELREKNILKEMVSVAEESSKIACIGPEIYSLNKSICAPYCRRLSLYNMTIGCIFEKKYRKKHIGVSGEVYRVYGCCMLLRNEAMDKIKCMDERTFLYGEEDILAERILKGGYITFYDASVSVTHKESSSMKRMSKNRKKMQIKENNKSLELYLKEYRNFPWIARLLCRITRSLIIYLR